MRHGGDFFPHVLPCKRRRWCFRIDRNNTKMDASRASLHLAYLIHLYGLSLINSFLTRLPALVPSRSHDKTSLTSSTICSAASARRDSHTAIAEIEVVLWTLSTWNSPSRSMTCRQWCSRDSQCFLHPPIVTIDIADVEFTIIYELFAVI